MSEGSIPLVNEAERIKREPRTEAEARIAKHTPTPWHRDRCSGVNCDVRAENGRKVALTWGLHTTMAAQMNTPAYKAECDANANLIVLAVNSYDAMKRALEALQPLIDEEIEQRQTGGNDEDWTELQQRSDQLHAALALARGEKPKP